MSPLRGSASKVTLKVTCVLTPPPTATIYMTHLCLYPALLPTLVFTRPLRQKRPSYRWPDSCDTSAKQRACYPAAAAASLTRGGCCTSAAAMYERRAEGAAVTGRFSYLLGSIRAPAAGNHGDCLALRVRLSGFSLNKRLLKEKQKEGNKSGCCS